MPLLGTAILALAFLTTLVSIIVLFMSVRGAKSTQGNSVQRLGRLGALFVGISALALTGCCLILVVGFLTGDTSLLYVVQYRSDTSSEFALLYKLSGLWAGRQGSLLFWAWLIALMGTLVAVRVWRGSKSATGPGGKNAGSKNASGKNAEGAAPGTKNAAAPARAPREQQQLVRLDAAALALVQLVLIAFLAILVFDAGNAPFVALPSEYLDANGALTGNAVLWGLNSLLEHWAMAIHPPTLFVGYAGMTIPFAYALAALIVNNHSGAWVERAQRFTLVSWLFLGAGIGLGAIWAYVVLGWGGYWGWDPVENASLLSWIIGVALVHSMTVYRGRGAYKRWTVMCACLTFAFVIVGTFISRSGIVQSVHAFEANPVSTALFGSLILLSVAAGAALLIWRRHSFKDTENAAGEDASESLVSRSMAYYFNNIIMLVCTLAIAYMTIAQALPSWLPLGGQVQNATFFNSIARPVGILYCLLIAVCPLLAWSRSGGKQFFKQMRLPALGALISFVLLMVYFATTLLPAYMQNLGAGDTAASELLKAGPVPYYLGLTIFGFFVASLLVFNSLVLLVRALRKGRFVASRIGGFTAHLAMGVILVGLIGSSMYVSEHAGYMTYDEHTNVAGAPFTLKDYSLSYVSNTIETAPNGNDTLYTVVFDVERNGEYLGQVAPAVQVAANTGQQKLIAAVISEPLQDLFVVYRGVNNEGSFSLDVRINPLVSFVWVGFGLLMLGTALASFGRRGPARKKPELTAERPAGSSPEQSLEQSLAQTPEPHSEPLAATEAAAEPQEQ